MSKNAVLCVPPTIAFSNLITKRSPQIHVTWGSCRFKYTGDKMTKLRVWYRYVNCDVTPTVTCLLLWSVSQQTTYLLVVQGHQLSWVHSNIIIMGDESNPISWHLEGQQIIPMCQMTRPWPPFRVSSTIRSFGAPHYVTVIMPKKQCLGAGDKKVLFVNWFSWFYTKRAQLYRVCERDNTSGYNSTKW